MELPTTHYTKSGDVHIAYQVVGQGPIDIVFVQGFISNLEVQWEDPGLAHLLTRLAGFARLILFDKRGSGLSDRVAEMPTLETRMDDVRAVMDAAGSDRAVLLGASEGGPLSILFGATYPARTRALVLYGAYAHFLSWVQNREQVAAFIAATDANWGNGASLAHFAPCMLTDARFCNWWARFERLGATPAAAIALARMNSEIDVRSILPALLVPTLVIHRRDDVRVNVAAGRYLAKHIPNARYVEIAGSDHPIWVGDTDRVVDEIEAYLTGIRPAPIAARVLATVMAVNLVGALACAASLGDHRWLRVLRHFHNQAAELTLQFRGRGLGSVHDALLATFDGPTRAARCALAIRGTMQGTGLQVRAGLHTGELETCDGAFGGMAVNVAAQIAAIGRPGEVIASGTTHDLMIGAPLWFADRGACALDGLAEHIRLYVVSNQPFQTLPARPAASCSVLTRRESEVLNLIAHGATNPGIAMELRLSEHTVKRHVANILLKLDLPTRSAAAAFAARHAR